MMGVTPYVHDLERHTHIIYIYIYIYMQLYIHTCKYIEIWVHMFVYIYVCRCMTYIYMSREMLFVRKAAAACTVQHLQYPKPQPLTL